MDLSNLGQSAKASTSTEGRRAVTDADRRIWIGHLIIKRCLPDVETFSSTKTMCAEQGVRVNKQGDAAITYYGSAPSGKGLYGFLAGTKETLKIFGNKTLAQVQEDGTLEACVNEHNEYYNKTVNGEETEEEVA